MVRSEDSMGERTIRPKGEGLSVGDIYRTLLLCTVMGKGIFVCQLSE